MIYASKMHTLRLCWALAVGVAVTLCVFEILPLYETVSMENMMAGRAWVADIGVASVQPFGAQGLVGRIATAFARLGGAPNRSAGTFLPIFWLHRDA